MKIQHTGKTEKKKASAWRMDQLCANCPFAKSGPGLALRKSLRPGRWREILRALLRGEVFWCHKTTGDGEWDEDGTYHASHHERICAGAIAYQEDAGTTSQVQQIMERLERRDQLARQHKKGD